MPAVPCDMQKGMSKMIAIGNDHGGYRLKRELLRHLDERKILYRDLGCESEASCDYPDYARAVCRAVGAGECETGVLICGTGIGMSIAANKCRGIRAACCSDTYSARFSRRHNDANVLCLGGRVIGPGLACELLDIFLATPYDGGERHGRRLQKIADLEKSGGCGD